MWMIYCRGMSDLKSNVWFSRRLQMMTLIFFAGGKIVRCLDLIQPAAGLNIAIVAEFDLCALLTPIMIVRVSLAMLKLDI